MNGRCIQNPFPLLQKQIKTKYVGALLLDIIAVVPSVIIVVIFEYYYIIFATPLLPK